MSTLNSYIDTDITFWVPFSNPDNPLYLHKGTGSLSFTRATTATYQDPITGLIKIAQSGQLRIEKNGALIEGQRTNLMLQSEDFTAGQWVDVAGGTATRGNVTSSIHWGNLALVTTTSLSGGIRQVISGLATATQHYCSCYVAGGTVGKVTFKGENSAVLYGIWTSAVLDLALGTFSGANPERFSSTPFGSGWLVTWDVGISKAVGPVQFNFEVYADGETESGKTFYFGVPQFEAASFASSYIPTTTAAVTRNADLLSAAAGNVLEGPFTLAYEFERVNNTDDGDPVKAPVLIGTYATDASMVIGGYQGVHSTVLANFGTVWSLIKGFADLSYGTKYNMAYRLAADLKTVSHARDGAMDPTGDGVAPSPKTAVWAGGRLDIGNKNGTITHPDTMFHIRNLRIWSRSFSDVEMKVVTAATT